MDERLLNEANSDLETNSSSNKKIIVVVMVSIAVGFVVVALAALMFYFFYLKNGNLDLPGSPTPLNDPDPGDTYPFIPVPKIVKGSFPFFISIASTLLNIEDGGEIDYAVYSRQKYLR